MINGNSVIFQIGKESTYGTQASPSAKVNFNSESFTGTRNKTAEGLLTGGITSGMVETMSISAEGNLSTIAKPDTVGIFLKAALGAETVTAASDKYLHTFTPIGNTVNDNLPSYTILIDRIAEKYAYLGMKVNTLSFSAAPEDRLSMDIGFNGKCETTGITMGTGLIAETNKSFKFRGGKVYNGSNEIADITSIGVEYNNNLDTSTFTTSTGLYAKEPSHGMREIKFNLEAIYQKSLITFKSNYWDTDDTFSLKVTFEDDNDNVLEFSMPCCQLESMGAANASGADTLKQSFSAKALDNASGAFLAKLTNDVSEEY